MLTPPRQKKIKAVKVANRTMEPKAEPIMNSTSVKARVPRARGARVALRAVVIINASFRVAELDYAGALCAFDRPPSRHEPNFFHIRVAGDV